MVLAVTGFSAAGDSPTTGGVGFANKLMVEAGESEHSAALKTRNLLIFRDAQNVESGKIAPNWNVSGIGKRKDSLYESGRRTGAWIKHRLNNGQELVIGGYVPGTHGLDAIIVGFYRGKDLIYVARVRNGFVPASRRQVYEKLRPLVSPECPFVNLPEKHRARWGEGLTAEDMKKCIWLRPALVAQIEFLEWTESDHLGHSNFVGLREDKEPTSVVRE